jgi:1-deoxy-D-xylulose-5-phosphate synthase
MVPRDENYLRHAVATALACDGPFAYRYPRGAGTGAKPEKPRTLDVGRGEKLREGKDGVVFAVGALFKEALAAVEALAEDGLDLAIVDPVFIKPLDKTLLIAEAVRTGFVVTVEENVLQGGFGSAVLELFCEEGLTCPVTRIGLPDKFVEQGSQSELWARYGLDARGIVATVKAATNKA